MIQSAEVITCLAKLATQRPHTPQLTSKFIWHSSNVLSGPTSMHQDILQQSTDVEMGSSVCRPSSDQPGCVVNFSF